MLRVARFYGSHSTIYKARYCPSFLSTSPSVVFDNNVKRIQRARALQRQEPSLYDYLRDEAAFRLSDRVYDINRVFDKAIDLGCGKGHLIQHLTSDSVKFIYQCDSSIETLKFVKSAPDVETQLLNVDPEHLPFAENSLNLVLSSLSLHWVNDISSTLSHVLYALKPDGCFLGVIFATDTLFELRLSLQLAEIDRLGGFYPHVSPFIESPRFGELLKEHGFTLISLDVDEIVIHYPSMFDLMDDLRGMGESNAALNRPLRLNKDVLFAASSIYEERFGTQREGGEEDERCIPATFRLLFFIAWKPDLSQPKPLPRGSGEFSLRDIGRLDEISAEIEKKYSKPPSKIL